MNMRPGGIAVVEPTARFEEVEIPLDEPQHGRASVEGVLGVPEWWPTGSRIGIVLAHGAGRDMNDPLIVGLHRRLTERKHLSLRFNFPFGQAKRPRPDSFPVLERAFRSALGVLGRDPTAAPAHLFVGGLGIGGLAAAQVAARLRVNGVFLIGYPLHSRDQPERNVKADALYRLVAPLLFIQGTRDRNCDLDALRSVLARVGTVKALHVVEGADGAMEVPKRSGRTPEDVVGELLNALDSWCRQVIGL
jgi:predicted alpha/beta-hydrolase family hydrolase